jgi:predicted dehydrogenase
MDFGIISLGNHALTRVMPAIRASGSDVTHIYSSDRSKGERVSKEYGAEYVPDLENFVKKPFEAVYISSPNALHFTHSKMSLDAGKSVLLEKPVTLKIEDTKKLANLSEREGIPFCIGFHLRFHPAVKDVSSLLAHNAIGKVMIVSGKFTGHSSRNSPRGTWWDTPEMAGGGSIVGRGVHVMDSFVNLFGKDVVSLSAINNPKCSIIEDTMYTTIEFRSGIIANSLSSRVITSNSNDLEILGTEGSIVVTNFYSTEVASKLLLNDKSSKEYGEKTNMYLEEIRDFTRKREIIAGSEDAVLSTKMHLLSQESACRGRSVTIPG